MFFTCLPTPIVSSCIGDQSCCKITLVFLFVTYVQLLELNLLVCCFSSNSHNFNVNNKNNDKV